MSSPVSTTGTGDASMEEEEVCCHACGFEASFVPEGMMPCERCGEVSYCSIECLQWDWKSGGHDKTCVDKRPTEESESSDPDADQSGLNFLAGVASTQQQQPSNKSTTSKSFDSDDASVMSMDITHLFGLAPGAVTPDRSDSAASGDSSGASRSNKGNGVIAVEPNVKADVQGKKSFWEAKTKQDTPTAPSTPQTPSKKGGTSKLAAFFEAQSPKSPERHPAPLLTPTKKNKLGPPGGMVSSFGQTSQKSQDEDESDDSMGEDDFGYAMGQHVVDNPMDESFDFMDKSVQTSGLKSIVEEGDSWTAEEPDLEGSWRSRNPFEVELGDDVEGAAEELGSEHKSNKSNKSSSAQARESAPAIHQNMTNMLLGRDDEDDETLEDSLWESRTPTPSRQAAYVEPDDDETYEEVVEEETLDEEYEEEEHTQEQYEEEYEDQYEETEEEEFEDAQEDETMEEEYEEVEEDTEEYYEEEQLEEDSTIEHTDNTDKTPEEALQSIPPPVKRKQLADSHLTPSFRLQKKATPSNSSRNPYAPGYSLNLTSHSEEHVEKASSNGSARRRSLGANSAASSKAASLLDFRQCYTDANNSESTKKSETTSSRLKDFREAYNGPSQEESITGEGEIFRSKAKEVKGDNSSQTSDADDSNVSKKSVNQALKTSINKALRDFEKLYGAEAARAAVARLTQAVGNDTPEEATPTTTAVVQAVVGEGTDRDASAANKTTQPTGKKSLLDMKPPETPRQSKHDARLERTLSPSSWAMPSDVSVSTHDSDVKPFQLPPGFGGKQPRSQSMPMIGGYDPPLRQMKRENSLSSWGYTGMSVTSGGNKSDGNKSEASPQPVSHPSTVVEGSVEFSAHSDRGTEQDAILESKPQVDPRSSEARSLQRLGLGNTRKGNLSRHNSKDSNGFVNTRSNHTQESNMASSWAFGFGGTSILPEDDYQVATSKTRATTDEQSSEQWLADLALSSQRTQGSQKPVVETINGDTDEEDSTRYVAVSATSKQNENESEGSESIEAFDSTGHSSSHQAEEALEEEDASLENVLPESGQEREGDEREVDQNAKQIHPIESPPAEPLSSSESSKVPRYMQYRNALAKTQYGKETARQIAFDQANDASMNEADSNPEMGRNLETPEEHRYMKYRSKLATTVLHEKTLPTSSAVESQAEQSCKESDEEGIDTLSAVPSIETGTSRFQKYRSTLAKRVNPESNEALPESAKRAQSAGVLTPAGSSIDSSSSAPRYQNYRSTLAQKVSTTGVENTLNAGNNLERESIGKTHDADKAIVASTIAGGDASSKSMPRYQQYRSSLAQNVQESSSPVMEEVVPFAASAPEEMTEIKGSFLEKAGVLASTATAPPESAPIVVAPVNDGSVPRYAKYRSSLAQRLSTTNLSTVASSDRTEPTEAGQGASVPSTALDQGQPSQTSRSLAVGAASAGSAAAISSRVGAEDENQTDEAFKAQLSNFLAKGEKGKKPYDRYDEEKRADDDADPEKVAREEALKANKEPTRRELVENQSRKIAAALSSSSQFLGRQQAVNEAPKESRLQTSQMTKSDVEMSTNRTLDRDESVKVNCKSGDLDDIESGRKSRQAIEPTLSEAEMGRKRYLRNQCYAYGLLICLLVAMPLGIGLGIGLTGQEDKDLPIFIETPTVSPTASPVVLTTDSPIETPAAGSPTSSPIIAGTLSPSFLDTTSPTLTQTLGPTTTAAPSANETVIGDEELFELLSSVSFDNGTSIQIPGSAQNQAFTWLAESENLNTLTTERLIQRYTLATLYYSADGPLWSQSLGWLSDSDECSWFSTSSGDSCDEDGVLRTLDLGFNGLMGTLPPEMGLLTGLTRIDLSGGVGPGIGGSLPTELALLTSLEIFSIHDNAITGQLFSDIGAWSNLRILSLRKNEMTGDLPAEIGDLVGLSFLDVSDNGFSGPVPASIGQLRDLVTLNLGNNAFTSLPASVGDLANLFSLKAPFNSLSGPLFDDWDDLVNLEDLDLQSNNLSGPLPPSLGRLDGLLTLDLSSNEFSSPIPPSFGGLTNILILRLNSNQLSGNIPAALGQLEFLSEIRIDDNDLVGAVPTAVCDTFEINSPKFYLDCDISAPEVTCPPGLCCTYCCTDGDGCECVFADTPSAFLC